MKRWERVTWDAVDDVTVANISLGRVHDKGEEVREDKG